MARHRGHDYLDLSENRVHFNLPVNHHCRVQSLSFPIKLAVGSTQIEIPNMGQRTGGISEDLQHTGESLVMGSVDIIKLWF